MNEYHSALVYALLHAVEDYENGGVEWHQVVTCLNEWIDAGRPLPRVDLSKPHETTIETESQ